MMMIYLSIDLKHPMFKLVLFAAVINVRVNIVCQLGPPLSSTHIYPQCMQGVRGVFFSAFYCGGYVLQYVGFSPGL